MDNPWLKSLGEAQVALQTLLADHSLVSQCAKLGEALTATFEQSAKVLICGNGGSHCDALHFAEEFTGRYRQSRRPLPALALGEASHATCVGNDYGFEKIFSRQIEAFAQKNDLLIVLSTSGNSANVLEALRSAKKHSVATWALLGNDGGPALALADQAIVAPGRTTDRIQELHMLILHVAIEHVERNLFPENYKEK